MDVEKLKTGYEANAAVRAICDHMASRDRNQNETKLRRLLTHLQNDGYDFKKGEVIAGLRLLEDSGCGRYIEGRHGWPSRFVWQVKSLHVSASATGKAVAEDVNRSAEIGEEEVDLIEHTFMLRPELPITFDLPTDLSKTEANRLAGFLQTLPFEEE